MSAQPTNNMGKIGIKPAVIKQNILEPPNQANAVLVN